MAQGTRKTGSFLRLGHEGGPELWQTSTIVSIKETPRDGQLPQWKPQQELAVGSSADEDQPQDQCGEGTSHDPTRHGCRVHHRGQDEQNQLGSSEMMS
jgi:hypothetical protein